MKDKVKPIVAHVPEAVLAPPVPFPALSDADRDLVLACQAGDRPAQERLYHAYKRRVFALLIRIVGSQDADEVAQEVFIRIFRGIARFKGESALGTWIYRLTVNAALSYVQRRPSRHDGEEELGKVPAPPTASRDPHLAARLERALAQLPPGYRVVMVLHDVEGLSHDEIATIVGCRVGTSKSQLFKARAKMRQLLGGGEP